MSETMLFEIADICTAFESLLQQQSKVAAEQMQQICEMARIEITEKDKRIEELEDLFLELYEWGSIDPRIEDRVEAQVAKIACRQEESK